jgi:DIS3-like exonuclease 2
MNECPKDFYLNSQNYEQTLFIAELSDIPMNSKYADGHLKCIIGEQGDLNGETDALLIENAVDFREYENIIDVEECLPQIPWSIPQSEFSYRQDLRNTCIFTIDPETARDLDDALHVRQIDDNHFEVGVHIADVSYFIKEDSPIDLIARDRATSVYLVQKVIPMLPRLFCKLNYI